MAPCSGRCHGLVRTPNSASVPVRSIALAEVEEPSSAPPAPWGEVRPAEAAPAVRRPRRDALSRIRQLTSQACREDSREDSLIARSPACRLRRSTRPPRSRPPKRRRSLLCGRTLRSSKAGGVYRHRRRRHRAGSGCGLAADSASGAGCRGQPLGRQDVHDDRIGSGVDQQHDSRVRPAHGRQ